MKQTNKFWQMGALAACLLAAPLAQAASMSWEDDLCTYRGTYDAKQHQPTQIKNVLQALMQLTSVNLDFRTPYQPEDLSRLDGTALQALESEYKTVKARASGLAMGSDSRAKSIKQQWLAAIDEEYQLNRLVLRAYLEPTETVLKDTPKACQRYLIPLTKGERGLMAGWQAFNEEQIQAQERLDNGDYRSIAESRFQEEYAADAISYAKINLIGFGLNNCLVDQRQNWSAERVYEEQQAYLRQVFGRSIKEVSCDEP